MPHSIPCFFIYTIFTVFSYLPQMELNLQAYIDLYHPARRAVIPWRLGDSHKAILCDTLAVASRHGMTVLRSVEWVVLNVKMLDFVFWVL